MTSHQIPSDVNKVSTIEFWGEKNSAEVEQVGGFPPFCDLLPYSLTHPITMLYR